MINQESYVIAIRKFSFALIGILLSISGYQAHSDAGLPVPDEIPGVQKVDAEGLIELVNNIPTMKIIDARIKQDRKQGYIQGSVSLPNIETSCQSLAKVIPDSNSPTLFYCNGVKCGRSVVAIEIAQKCGYKKIYWFRGGFEEWQEKGYPFLQE